MFWIFNLIAAASVFTHWDRVRLEHRRATLPFWLREKTRASLFKNTFSCIQRFTSGRLENIFRSTYVLYHRTKRRWSCKVMILHSAPFPDHLFDWLRGKCQMKTCALFGKQEDEICGRNKESMSRSMWLILAHSAAIRWAILRRFNMKDRGLGLFFFFFNILANWILRDSAAHSSSSKAGYVPGLSMQYLCLL